jgi:hypothetical protein
MTIPNNEIHNLLKNAEPEISDYVVELEAKIADLEADKVVSDTKIVALEAKLKEMLVRGESPDNKGLSELMQSVQGNVLRPEVGGE